MFGNKQEKQERLSLLERLLRGGWRSQADLARETGVNRATIHKDLVKLEDKGVLLAEDDDGRVTFFGRR